MPDEDTMEEEEERRKHRATNHSMMIDSLLKQSKDFDKEGLDSRQ